MRPAWIHGYFRLATLPGGGGRTRRGTECRRGWLDWSADPSHGVYPANSPRAGRQQGYAGSEIGRAHV